MFYKPGEDTVVLVYVDDMFVDGRKKHMDKFFADFQSRFKTTEVEWLTADEPLDFNGIIISMDDVCVYMDMYRNVAKWHETTADLLLSHNTSSSSAW